MSDVQQALLGPSDAGSGEYSDRPAELTVKHGPSQTLVGVETQCGSVVAAVEVGHIGLDDRCQLGREIRDAFDRATSGGDA